MASYYSRAVHTSRNGDVLYAVTTNEVEPAQFDDMLLGMITSDLAWDAVLSSFVE